jgi:alkylated DNA repair dioxygenase AlkB
MSLINLIPTPEEQIIFLDANRSSWIKLKKLDLSDGGLSFDEFDELWSYKPDKKLQIKKDGKLIDCPRYSTSYLKPYEFSGLNHEANMNIPKRIAKLLDWCKEHYNNPNINQSLVNWYESDCSIGKHSDDITQLLPDSEIYSFSFGPATRHFYLEPNFRKDTILNFYRIKLDHNTLIIMGGTCQKEFRHSVPIVKRNEAENEGRRLNVTFRCMK